MSAAATAERWPIPRCIDGRTDESGRLTPGQEGANRMDDTEDLYSLALAVLDGGGVRSVEGVGLGEGRLRCRIHQRPRQRGAGAVPRFMRKVAQRLPPNKNLQLTIALPRRNS